MPKIRDIPRLKASFLALYDKGLISPGLFVANVNRLEALERREQRRLLSVAKTANDRALASNSISDVQWFANWKAICAAREALENA